MKNLTLNGALASHAADPTRAISTNAALSPFDQEMVAIEYVAIKIISHDLKTTYSEYAMHQPNRHDDVRRHIKNVTGKLPQQMGTVQEGFKTDGGSFLTRQAAMDLHRSGRLMNSVKLQSYNASDKEMQSTYLW
jgi:hypothetical protein